MRFEPMETAPKDGTEILMRFDNPHKGKDCCEYDVVRWDDRGFWKVEGLNAWCGDLPWDAESSSTLKASGWKSLE